MTNEAMEKAFQEWRGRHNNIKDMKQIMDFLRTLENDAFAAGYHARDAEVAELQKKTESLEDGVPIAYREGYRDGRAELEAKVAELERQLMFWNAKTLRME